MSKLVLCLLMIALVAISGCAQMEKSNEKDCCCKPGEINESINISSGNMTFPAYLGRSRCRRQMARRGDDPLL